MDNQKDIDELEETNLREEIEDNNKARDAQRNMAWFALFGMLLYPFAVIIVCAVKLDNAATILGSLAGTYFVSTAGIVAAFYAKEVFMNRDKLKHTETKGE